MSSSSLFASCVPRVRFSYFFCRRGEDRLRAWICSRPGGLEIGSVKAVLALLAVVVIIFYFTMSSNLSADEMMCYCAGCGKAEVDEIKLKECTDCDLVRYCSDTCHREHRPKHNEIVRNEPLNYGMKFCFGSHKAASP